MTRTRIILVLVLLLLAVTSLHLTVGRATGPSITIDIDAAANHHPINPNIYGVAYATSAQLADLNAPLNRSGGNTTTRYNWQCNCANHASDWYFESLDEGGATPGKLNDDFIATTKAGNSIPMLTIPTIGWVAKLG